MAQNYRYSCAVVSLIATITLPINGFGAGASMAGLGQASLPLPQMIPATAEQPLNEGAIHTRPTAVKVSNTLESTTAVGSGQASQNHAQWPAHLDKNSPLVASTHAAPAPATTAPRQTSSNGHRADTGQRWTLNQQNSDIREFIAQVASITGDTFVIDPQVSGHNVTVISSQPLTRSQVYDIFLSVLDANGFAAVPQGDRTRITVANNAKSLGTKIPSGQKPHGGYIETQVIPLVHISAVEVIPVIRPLIAHDGHAAAIPSSNSVVINDHLTNLKRLVSIIHKMDRADANGFEVIQLKHAWAGDLAKVIMKTLQPKTPQAIDLTQIIADEGGNRLIVFGNAGRRQQIKRLARELDVPSNKTSATMVINLRYADAKKLAEILQKVSKNLIQQDTAYGEERSPLKGSVVVEADEAQNALVIVADPDTQQQLTRLVRQLDVKRDQILLETAIVEFSGNADQALGVQWGLSGLATNTNTQQTVSGGTITNNTIGAVTGFNPGAIPLGTVALRNQTFGALVSAIASRTNSNLLSTPSLLTLDNEKASIFVGEERSFRTGSYTGSQTGNEGSSFSNPFTTTDRKPVGLTLKVTPHINDGGGMRLVIEQKIQNVVPGANQVQGEEVVSDRELKTTVLVNNKQTIVLGGLLSDSLVHVNSKVPVLGDIPVLGELFRYTSQRREKRNLMVFIQPTIITKQHDADGLSYDKYSQMLFLSRAKGKDNYNFTPLEVPKTPSAVFQRELNNAQKPLKDNSNVIDLRKMKQSDSPK